jgi:type II secretory pathway pseudopilin PulG
MARFGHGSQKRGYTLVELLIATTLTLVMMGAVATLFGTIGQSVATSRATMEMSDALRGTTIRLRTDLSGVLASDPDMFTPPPWPPKSAGADKTGYFEYVEGPVGPDGTSAWPVTSVTPGYVARNTDVSRAPSPRPPNPPSPDPDQILFEQDTTVGDTDDILMFTARLDGERLVGKYYSPTLNLNTTIESSDAEIAWFVRGNTLYRRQLLIVPLGTAINTSPAGFYANNDISVHLNPATGLLELNSLADDPTLQNGLARPENRFAHRSGAIASGNFPYHPSRVAGWANAGTPAGALARLNLPLLQETADPLWPVGGVLPSIFTAGGAGIFTVALNPNVRNASAPGAPVPFDAWFNPHPWEPFTGSVPVVDKETGILIITDATHPYYTSTTPPTTPATNPLPLGCRSGRYGEDVILNNVLAFDVKAWDPLAPVISVSRTQSGVTETFLVLPGDYPRYLYVPDPNYPTRDITDPTNPNSDQYTGYARALAQFSGPGPFGIGATATATDSTAKDSSGASSPIVYTYTVVGIGAYVDLGYGVPIGKPNVSTFSGNGAIADRFIDPPPPGVPRLPRVYDTWTNHYESNFDSSTPPVPIDDDFGFDGGAGGNQALDGADNGPPPNPDGIPDNATEREAPRPYSPPLPGIQIKIRVFEPDSRQIREVTIVQDFRP